ncbi:MAG TPA: GntR family transcriptional regulator [Bryobacteraceae bacterium]|nr:GntR family transcriptional regulator [Bryobacteraceae bacterium]
MEIVKLQRQRAVDAVYDALRSAIINSLLRPGERLNVDELAERLGVSLTPVRGAIQQLATEGLIEIRPRSGTFVASLTVQDVDETFRIRCALECLAARDAIDKFTDRDIKQLKDLLRALKKPVRTDEDRTAHDKNNSLLHQMIIRASGNRRLQDIYESLHAHLRIARIHAGHIDWVKRVREEQMEHESIVAAIERRDAAALEKALTHHIYRAKDDMIRALREREERASDE